MNHTSRAKGIVGRAMPRVLYLSDGTNVDVTAWHKELEREVAKGLRLAERDAWRKAIRTAANFVGERASNTTHAVAVEAIRGSALAVLELERER